jgi:hypothetical protein
MTRNNFIMSWPVLGIEIECEPRDNGMEWLYDWWIERMPFRYVQSHAFLTGEVINSLNVRMGETLPDPTSKTVEIIRQNKTWPGLGHFSYNTQAGLSGGRVGAIGVCYGPMFEDMDGYWCFQVVERDLDRLKQAGRQIWQAVYKTKLIIIAEVKEKIEP